MNRFSPTFYRLKNVLKLIHDYSGHRHRCNKTRDRRTKAAKRIYHGLRNLVSVGCYMLLQCFISGALVYILRCLHLHSFESYDCLFTLYKVKYPMTKGYRFLHIFISWLIMLLYYITPLMFRFFLSAFILHFKIVIIWLYFQFSLFCIYIVCKIYYNAILM